MQNITYVDGVGDESKHSCRDAKERIHGHGHYVHRLKTVVLGIFSATLDKMHFDVLQMKLFLKEVDYKINVNAILTSIHIRTKKVPARECVNGDMALGDDHKSTPTAGVLDVIVGCRNNLNPCERMHVQVFTKFHNTTLHHSLT